MVQGIKVVDRCDLLEWLLEWPETILEEDIDQSDPTVVPALFLFLTLVHPSFDRVLEYVGCC